MPKDKDAESEKNDAELHNADPKCRHKIKTLWSGIECVKCKGWFCY